MTAEEASSSTVSTIFFLGEISALCQHNACSHTYYASHEIVHPVVDICTTKIAYWNWVYKPERVSILVYTYLLPDWAWCLGLVFTPPTCTFARLNKLINNDKTHKFDIVWCILTYCETKPSCKCECLHVIQMTAASL